MVRFNDTKFDDTAVRRRMQVLGVVLDRRKGI